MGALCFLREDSRVHMERAQAANRLHLEPVATAQLDPLALGADRAILDREQLR